jgi:oligopeptide transport system substrate-binding protein
VKLERVLFVDKSDADDALAAYRAGEIDAVTNAAIEPLAVKLLTPYKDFRRGTFAALNYYDFNTARPPFDDRRVREAFALALDPVRLSADTLGGATEPADRFLPVPNDEAADADEKSGGDPESNAKAASEEDGGDEVKPLKHDVVRARSLLAEAGYPGGQNFPRIRLLVNRNEQQRALAQAVARTWRDALGVETDVIVRPWEEYEAMLSAGDFDIARRSIVMQTTDEESNMIELFGDEPPSLEVAEANGAEPQQSPTATPSPTVATPSRAKAPTRVTPILTEAQALRELPAIPLHFASSYALVKPYVEGFESNLLDAPSLKNVRINTGWNPPPQGQAVNPPR